MSKSLLLPILFLAGACTSSKEPWRPRHFSTKPLNQISLNHLNLRTKKPLAQAARAEQLSNT